MATLGFGTKIGYDTVSPFDGPYTNIAEVKSISGPNITVGSVDTTVMLSADGFREFIHGLADAGEITFTVLWAKAQHSTLYGLIRTKVGWQVLFPDIITTASKWEAIGHITGISAAYELEGDMVVDFTVKLTGKPTFTAGT